MKLYNEFLAWSETSKEYCHATIENVKRMLKLYRTQPLEVFITKENERPFPELYRPRIDATKVIWGDFNLGYLN